MKWKCWSGTPTIWSSRVVESFQVEQLCRWLRRSMDTRERWHSVLDGRDTSYPDSDIRPPARQPAPDSNVRLPAAPGRGRSGLDWKSQTSADRRCIGTRPLLYHHQQLKPWSTSLSNCYFHATWRDIGIVTSKHVPTATTPCTVATAYTVVAKLLESRPEYA